MSRARLVENPVGGDFEAVGRIILAAWLKSLPDVEGDPPTPIDASEISAALTNILSIEVEAVVDQSNKNPCCCPADTSHDHNKSEANRLPP